MKRISNTNILTNHFAFTLSEVLITLAIIGVVAAITIPNVIKNYQRKAWATGLKKTYSTSLQVVNLAMVKEGVDDLTQTTLYNAVLNHNFASIRNEYFTNAVIKDNVKFSKFQYKNMNGELQGWYLPGQIVSVELPNSTIFMTASISDIVFYVDANGYKTKPNKAGADFFTFEIDKNGKLNIEQDISRCHVSKHVLSNAQGCFTKVIWDVWGIKYDIPSGSYDSQGGT